MTHLQASPADRLAARLLNARKEKVPDYAFDCHTLKGKTKADFFREEQVALEPFQPGLFDDDCGCPHARSEFLE